MRKVIVIITVFMLGGLTAIGPDWYTYAQEGGFQEKQYQHGRGSFETNDAVVGTSDPEVMKHQYRDMNMSDPNDSGQTSEESELEIDDYGDPKILQWGLWGEPWGPCPEPPGPCPW